MCKNLRLWIFREKYRHRGAFIRFAQCCLFHQETGEAPVCLVRVDHVVTFQDQGFKAWMTLSFINRPPSMLQIMITVRKNDGESQNITCLWSNDGTMIILYHQISVQCQPCIIWSPWVGLARVLYSVKQLLPYQRIYLTGLPSVISPVSVLQSLVTVSKADKVFCGTKNFKTFQLSNRSEWPRQIILWQTRHHDDDRSRVREVDVIGASSGCAHIEADANNTIFLDYPWHPQPSFAKWSHSIPYIHFLVIDGADITMIAESRIVIFLSSVKLSDIIFKIIEGKFQFISSTFARQHFRSMIWTEG